MILLKPKPDLSTPALVVVLKAQLRRRGGGGLEGLILLLYHRDADKDGCEGEKKGGHRLECGPRALCFLTVILPFTETTTDNIIQG